MTPQEANVSLDWVLTEGNNNLFGREASDNLIH